LACGRSTLEPTTDRRGDEFEVTEVGADDEVATTKRAFHDRDVDDVAAARVAIAPTARA
jgi:hypothetical protein